jgi:hypothetical protein
MSEIAPPLILEDVDDDVKAYRIALESGDYVAAATKILEGARNIAYRLLESEGFEIIESVARTPYEQLDELASICINLVMKDGSELPPQIIIAKDLILDLRTLQATLEGRNPAATCEQTHMAIIICMAFQVSQNYTLAQMWENTFWDQFGKAKKDQFVAALGRSRGGGHNAKWVDIAKPYIEKEPDATRNRIAELILIDRPDADKSSIMRALKRT